ncbi:MAG: hypothetical protein J5704_00725 [Paludibacteraceae bacterium]|nr:hypothetical protein [Paludibacteraceae bacterium]
MQITYTGFLCGYFSAPKALDGEWLKTNGEWQQSLCTEQERATLNNYYFPEFAQCMTDDVKMYTRPINKPCVLDFGDEQVPFDVMNLRLWQAPFNIIVYAVAIRFEQADFNSVTRALNALRNCSYYNELQRVFVETALAPIVAIYNTVAGENKRLEGELSWLVESGNKFKLFQIIQVPEGIGEGDEQLLLYDAGTLGRHTPLSTGMNSATYIEHILSEHTISVFAGWTGLALLDTFTLLSADTPDRVVTNWEKDYFEKIYIYQLFRKVFLYSVNLHYRRRIEDVTVLESRLDEFEQQYSYPAISYNFLPNIINTAIEKSLNTQRDYDQLNKMISKEIENRRDQTEARMNHFLMFLTCLTIFSAIYDLASLLNESFGYDTLFPDGHIGFRLVSTSLLVLVLVVYLFFTRRK